MNTIQRRGSDPLQRRRPDALQRPGRGALHPLIAGALVATALLTATVVAPTPAAAQDELGAPEHLALVSANAMVGAVSAGIAAWIRGEDVSRAFLLGAGGGSLGYVGKLTVTARFTGAPIAGRQLAAVGHSIVANAAAGEAALSEIWLPISPLRVRLPFGGAEWGVRLDLMDSATLLFGVFRPELQFDPGLSLRQGTPVFVARGYEIRLGEQDLAGVATSGTILLSGDVEGEARQRSILAHEMVHVIQSDLAKVAISYPIEAWAADALLPGWDGDVPVKGGFVAVLADLVLGGLRNEGIIRDIVERESEILVSSLPYEEPLR